MPNPAKTAIWQTKFEGPAGMQFRRNKARLRVGVMHNTINSRYGPKPLVLADYVTGVACGADSFWVADHLTSVLPPSMWTPKYVGAARVIPKMDAHLEPWTDPGLSRRP